MFHIKQLAPPPRANLSEPGEDAQADPDRREHHVEDEVGEDDQRPPHGPVAKRDRALLVLHALWRSSMTRNTRCAVSSIESSEMSITAQPRRRRSFSATSRSSY